MGWRRSELWFWQRRIILVRIENHISHKCPTKMQCSCIQPITRIPLSYGQQKYNEYDMSWMDA